MTWKNVCHHTQHVILIWQTNFDLGQYHKNLPEIFEMSLPYDEYVKKDLQRQPVNHAIYPNGLVLHEIDRV